MAQTTSILHDVSQPRIVGGTITLSAVNNLPPGSLAVLMILLTILLTAAGFFAVVADRRRKQAEAPNAELTNELRERKPAGEQSNRQIAELEARVAERTGQLDAAVASLQPEYEDREIDWKIGELPAIECDPALVKQAFTNLLSNAVKYTRLREKAFIEVGRVTTDGASTIFLRDKGTGFDQRHAHKLFGVFQRLHAAQGLEGTGVGLATVQRIVLRHGGRIWAEPEVDKGATFFFTLAAGCQGSANETKSVVIGEP
jgi:light-regulated signal transduction histidine kinase (bacteriophytochrome)